MASKKLYRVLHASIRHGERQIALRGWEVELTAEEAERYLGLGGVEPVEASKPESTEAPEKPLDERSRAELNALAADLGIAEPDKLANKGAVIDAVEGAQAGGGETPSTPEP